MNLGTQEIVFQYNACSLSHANHVGSLYVGQQQALWQGGDLKKDWRPDGQAVFRACDWIGGSVESFIGSWSSKADAFYKSTAAQPRNTRALQSLKHAVLGCLCAQYLCAIQRACKLDTELHEKRFVAEIKTQIDDPSSAPLRDDLMWRAVCDVKKPLGSRGSR
jgi:hypothetical protein